MRKSSQKGDLTSEIQMFCFQCEQTAEGKNCTKYGVCGKSPEFAALQDLLMRARKKVALALLDAFGIGVNEFSLSIVYSCYEQKAVAILLTLLYLGIKNIRLGPSLPAFITPYILSILVKNFNIIPITSPEKDLKAIVK